VQPAAAVADFVRLSIGGLALGVVVGYAISMVTNRVDDFQVEITLTAIAAYGAYLAGQYLNVSGILAVVAAGIVLGSFGRPREMPARTRQAIDLFWDYIAFLLNSLAFLLIGLQVPWRDVLANLGFVALAAGIALLARAVTVYLVLGLLRPFGQRVSLRWQHLLVWGGLRGVIAVALVLSLPGTGGAIGQLKALVYGVTLISIVIQGVTIGPLTRALLPRAGVTPDPGGR
jgi:CPA1 family monovalent cation:H+ antiporter